MVDDLASRTGSLVDLAITRARTPESASELRQLRARLDGPIRVAIAGRVKAGKSTLLNALLGEELAATDAGECTKLVTWYVHGVSPRVRLFPHEGAAVDLRFGRGSNGLEIDLGSRSPDQIDRLQVSWPTPRLQGMSVLDTPGIASISREISERTHRVMAADDGSAPVVDAVIYLLKHAHASDARFLEAFHAEEITQGTAMNAVGVLSRADEIGSCRLDSLEVAQRVAQRYEADGRLRRLCPMVVPVAGLLAYAAATLTETEFGLLKRIAALPAEELGSLLLSVDRFALRARVDTTQVERRNLLDRFGIFGVRLGVELIRSGATATADDLAREFTRRAGLVQLRSVLVRQFQDRATLLKARSALNALEKIIAGGGCTNTADLQARLERVLSSAHEFQEIRVLEAMRLGELVLQDDVAHSLERLLGGLGHDPATRLDLRDDADRDAMTEEALRELESWHVQAQHPLASRSTQLAARTAIRTLEGLIANLDQAN